MHYISSTAFFLISLLYVYSSYALEIIVINNTPVKMRGYNIRFAASYKNTNSTINSREVFNISNKEGTYFLPGEEHVHYIEENGLVIKPTHIEYEITPYGFLSYYKTGYGVGTPRLYGNEEIIEFDTTTNKLIITFESYSVKNNHTSGKLNVLYAKETGVNSDQKRPKNNPFVTSINTAIPFFVYDDDMDCRTANIQHNEEEIFLNQGLNRRASNRKSIINLLDNTIQFITEYK